MSRELNVLYQFDDNYAPFAGISILSLFSHNRDIDNLNVYCITLDVDDKNIKKLNDTADKYGRKINYIDNTSTIKKMEEVKVNAWNGSIATWMKMFVIEEFIGKVSSLLYIDCDTLVENTLEELCDYDFEGNAMACIADSIGFRHYRRLGLKESDYYFNAGVMFFNIEYFEENKDSYNSMIIHLRNNVEKYELNDQDLMNDFFDGKIKPLSPRYNYQGIHMMYPDNVYYRIYGKGEKYYSLDELKISRKTPCILHFFRVLGDYPWEPGNYHPVKKEFEKWKNRSLWRNLDIQPQKRKMFFKIERVLYLILPKRCFLRLFKYMKSRDK